MTTLTYRIDIDRPLAFVYDMACRVERHPEFIPDYLHCRILQRDGDWMLIERSALIRGKPVIWNSWLTCRPNEGLSFVHHGGRLDGMSVDWHFEPVAAHRTRMTITQRFRIRTPIPGLGVLLEQWLFAPKLGDIARRVIRHFKEACESTVEARQ